MALSSMLRKVSPSVVVPLALRAVASPRTLHDSILAVAFGLEESSGSISKGGGSFRTNRDFSTVADARKKADEKLLKAVQSELKIAEKYMRHNRLPPPPLPAKFPFRIYDLPGKSSIKLRREFEDEEIEVKIDTYQLLDIEEDYEYSQDSDTNDSSSNDTDDSGSDSSDDSQSDKGDQDGSDKKSSDYARMYQKYTPSIQMTVTVCKKSPYNFKRLPEVASLSTGCYWDERNYIQKSIEFTIAASKEEIWIQSMSFNDGPLYERYEGPNFKYMDKKLQDHFVKYLEVRGITSNIRTFVVKHVNNKKRRGQYEGMKKFSKFLKE
ncbi:hypothetical protein RJ639_031939 [Escallonia herrerae]|uniref:Uncharacterized protein n=1 Tax=Escallonia herrerae TaxID=1293975 RepID=A0AA88XF47_9ASTE|nr:hypothetical protein RJ639_031939 [Escallonia herrerae]